MTTSDDGKHGDAGLTSAGDVIVTPRRKLKLWHKILLAAAVAIAIGTAYPLYLKFGIKNVVEQHVLAIRSGKLDDAYALTAKRFRRITSKEDFSSFISRHEVLAENKEVSISAPRVKRNVGTIEGTATAKSGTAREIRFRLVKENGDWKIDAIHIKPDATN